MHNFKKSLTNHSLTHSLYKNKYNSNQNYTKSTTGFKFMNHVCILHSYGSRKIASLHHCVLGSSFTSYPTLLASYLVDSCYDAVGEGIEASEDVDNATPVRWIGLDRLLAGAPHGPLTKSGSHRAAMSRAGAAATTSSRVQCVPTKDVVHHHPESRTLHWLTRI